MENGPIFNLHRPSLSCSDALIHQLAAFDLVVISLLRQTLPSCISCHQRPFVVCRYPPLQPFSPSSFSLSKPHDFFQSLEFGWGP